MLICTPEIFLESGKINFKTPRESRHAERQDAQHFLKKEKRLNNAQKLNIMSDKNIRV